MGENQNERRLASGSLESSSCNSCPLERGAEDDGSCGAQINCTHHAPHHPPHASFNKKNQAEAKTNKHPCNFDGPSDLTAGAGAGGNTAWTRKPQCTGILPKTWLFVYLTLERLDRKTTNKDSCGLKGHGWGTAPLPAGTPSFVNSTSRHWPLPATSSSLETGTMKSATTCRRARPRLPPAASAAGICAAWRNEPGLRLAFFFATPPPGEAVP